MSNTELKIRGLVIDLLNSAKKEAAKIELSELIKALYIIRKYQDIEINYTLLHNCSVFCFGIDGLEYNTISFYNGDLDVCVNPSTKTVSVINGYMQKQLDIICEDDELSEELTDFLFLDTKSIKLSNLTENYTITQNDDDDSFI